MDSRDTFLMSYLMSFHSAPINSYSRLAAHQLKDPTMSSSTGMLPIKRVTGQYLQSVI